MNWNHSPSCWRGSIKVDFSPSAVVYHTQCNMVNMAVTPPLVCLPEWEGEIFSNDVIVVGDPEKKYYLLAGALTAYRSMTTFRAVCRNRRIVEIEAVQDSVAPDRQSEEIITLEGSDWCELLFQYADAAAKRNGVKPIDASRNLTGYCTWYYYYKDVTQAHLLENVEALAKNRSQYAAEYVQIDDGFQTLQGDWLDRHRNWPVPLDVTAKKIMDSGMKAGIWTMPFTASTASRVCRAHPDWFVKNAKGEIVTQNGWTPPPDNQWACLDTTVPEVREHLVKIFRTFRSWGYTYFKMDGLGFGLYEGLRHDPAATAVSAFRLGLQTIRDAVPDCVLLACSAHFLPCLGLADNIRVSNDTSRYFSADAGRLNYPVCSCDILTSSHISLSHFWKFDRWFRCDPDVVMARQDNAFYTRNEAKFSVLTAIMTGVALTSDHLGTIDPERLGLLAKARNLRMRNVRPILTQPNQWPQSFSGILDGHPAAALFNDTECEKSWTFSELGLQERCVELLDGETFTGTITLPPHDAALLTAAR